MRICLRSWARFLVVRRLSRNWLSSRGGLRGSMSRDMNSGVAFRTASRFSESEQRRPESSNNKGREVLSILYKRGREKDAVL